MIETYEVAFSTESPVGLLEWAMYVDAENPRQAREVVRYIWAVKGRDERPLLNLRSRVSHTGGVDKYRYYYRA